MFYNINKKRLSTFNSVNSIQFDMVPVQNTPIQSIFFKSPLIHLSQLILVMKQWSQVPVIVQIGSQFFLCKDLQDLELIREAAKIFLATLGELQKSTTQMEEIVDMTTSNVNSIKLAHIEKAIVQIYKLFWHFVTCHARNTGDM